MFITGSQKRGSNHGIFGLTHVAIVGRFSVLILPFTLRDNQVFSSDKWFNSKGHPDLEATSWVNVTPRLMTLIHTLPSE